MKSKITTVFAVAAVMVIGVTMKIYATNNFKESDFININNAENMRIAAQKVLDDIGREDFIEAKDIREISVTNGDVDGDGLNDKILTLDFGPNLSVIAVYKGDGESYSYLGEIGALTNIAAIETKRLAARNRDVIAIKEESIERLGGYEDNVFVRGYLWEDGEFVNIISIPESIEADWNSAWDTDDETPEKWNRIRSNAVISWEGTEDPIVKSRENQRYLVSSDTENKNIPADSTYNLVDSRNIEQIFKWNEEFGAFLLGFAIDNGTGERFGVVEDFDNSVYYEILEYEPFLNRVRLIDKDGNFTVKNKSDITFEALPQ